MKTVLAILAGLALSTSLTQAQPAVPVGPPPAFKIVTSTDKAKGLIMFRETRYEAVPEQREIVVTENGRQVTKTVTTLVTRTVQYTSAINAADSRVITPDGKQLPIDEVWKRVKANTVVVFSGNSEAPAPAYLRALNAETLVIIPAALKSDPIPPPKKE